MLDELVVPAVPGLKLDDCACNEDTLTLIMTSTQESVCCPLCAQISSRVHSRYQRRIGDVPCGDYRVRLLLNVRKFFCDNDACRRKVFCERLGSELAVYARRTVRLKRHLHLLAMALGGEMGSQVVELLHMPASPSTLLRLMGDSTDQAHPTPRVLGVDDWAKRKGQTYGTMLVDLEQHCLVDLLSERSAEALCAWLRAHPGVEIISRDRAGLYAEGATQGAPTAIQVADRWHLLSNLRDLLERLLDRHPAALRAAAQRVSDELTRQVASDPIEPPPLPVEEPVPCANQLRWAEVKRLKQEGWSARAIATHLHVHRQTVRKDLAADSFPQRTSRWHTSTVVPYLTYLRQRWAGGCHDRMQLWRELQAQGFTGGYDCVWRALRRFPTDRPARKPAITTTVHPLSARQAAWLFVRSIDELKPEENAYRLAILETCPDVAIAYPLTQQFACMVRQRQPDELDDWLLKATVAGVPELARCAASLQRDYHAVRAALTLPWSNGQVEGQINRLKLIKREMYGRASFILLKKRALWTPKACFHQN
jgi:transposase